MSSAGTFDRPPSRRTIADEIAEKDPDWKTPIEPVSLPDGIRWTPDLEKEESGAVLHVQLTPQIPSHIAKRILAAARDGRSVHVALPVEALWNLGAVRYLSEADSYVHVLDRASRSTEPLPVLKALASQEIRLPQEARAALGTTAWDRCSTATTANEKGVRLEHLLVFLLGQSQELRVVKSNHRTETEEIDIVTQARSAGLSRCWAQLGAPFILVEAKNWTSRVGKPVVSDLLTKLRGYRGTAKIGVLVGANGFTQDALTHELRYAAEEGTIAFVDQDQLAAWIAADNLDDYFEQLVQDAMLR